MREQDITNNNKLIAEFIGVKIDQNGRYNAGYSAEFMKYNSSWDWLMPVVNKIEYLYADKTSLPRFEINSHACSFCVCYPQKYTKWIVGCYSESPEKIKANSKLEAAWMVSVDFIKWYNLNKLKI